MGQIYLSHLMIQPGLPKEQKHKVLRRLVLETYQLAVLHKIHLVTWIEGGWPAAPHVHLADGLIFNMPATMYQVVHDAWGNHPDSFLPNDRPLYLEGASL